MMNEKKDGKLNINYGDIQQAEDSFAGYAVPSDAVDTAEMLTDEEIEAVEKMYLDTLDAEVPDIWSRIEAGVKKEAQFQSASDTAEGHVISLAEKRKKKKMWFTVIGAAAAVLLVLIPAAMFGGTRNSGRDGDSNMRNRKTYSLSGDGSAVIAGSMSDNHDSKNEAAMELDGESYAGDDENSKADHATEAAEYAAGGSEVREEYQVNGEGYIYKENDLLIFETVTGSRFVIANSDVFGEDILREAEDGKKVSVTIRGNFENSDESSGKIVISGYDK